MPKTSPIYYDHAATTPVHPQVVEVMKHYFLEEFGNASSTTHPYGEKAKKAIEGAKKQMAEILNGDPEKFIFTSGATEAINLAIKGMFEAEEDEDEFFSGHIITCQTEHKAVLDTCEYLEGIGAEVTYLPVDKDGRVDLQELERSIRRNTILIALMYVNNETGVWNC
ncbi:MAG: cysteine desulfurase family protein [Flavobacteriales bacterium]